MVNNWTLEEGLKLVRILQPETRKYGYHLTLGGSVLNKGISEKDLDLYFLPMNNYKFVENPQGLLDWLEGLWGKSYAISGEYQAEIEVELNNRIPLGHLPRFRVMRDQGGIPQLIPVPAPDNLKPKVGVGPIVQSVYNYKQKFHRGDDRIDVFIL